VGVSQPNNTFVLDDSQAPLLVVRQFGELSDEQFEEYLSELGKRFITIPRVLLVFDTTYAKPATAKHRRRQADWLLEHERDVVRCTVGAAFCAPGLLMRGALRAVMWVSPPKYPYYVTDTFDSALIWAAEKLRAEGHRLPQLLLPYAS